MATYRSFADMGEAIRKAQLACPRATALGYRLPKPTKPTPEAMLLSATIFLDGAKIVPKGVLVKKDKRISVLSPTMLRKGYCKPKGKRTLTLVGRSTIDQVGHVELRVW